METEGCIDHKMNTPASQKEWFKQLLEDFEKAKSRITELEAEVERKDDEVGRLLVEKIDLTTEVERLTVWVKSSYPVTELVEQVKQLRSALEKIVSNDSCTVGAAKRNIEIAEQALKGKGI